MTPALVKPGIRLALDHFVKDKDCNKLHEDLFEQLELELGSFRKPDYNRLNSVDRENLNKYLAQWVEGRLKGRDIPTIEDISRRFGLKAKDILAVNITNYSEDIEEFEADILILAEQITIAGTAGNKFIYAYGDVTSELNNHKSVTLYHISTDSITWFEEYQSI